MVIGANLISPIERFVAFRSNPKVKQPSNSGKAKTLFGVTLTTELSRRLNIFGHVQRLNGGYPNKDNDIVRGTHLKRWVNRRNTAVSTIVTPTYSSAVAGLAPLLTLIFVVILMVMAVGESLAAHRSNSMVNNPPKRLKLNHFINGIANPVLNGLNLFSPKCVETREWATL